MEKRKGTGGAEEEWVKAAMTDDTMVVELLVRLHGAAAAAAAPPPRPVLPLEWTVRQRRSRPVAVKAQKQPRSRRASPSTPLSWSGRSGATSLSGGSGGAGAGGGSEESSRPRIQHLSADARSKINGDSEKATSKRSRKKKTLAELKDEENTLLKEKRGLKRQIAALHRNLEKQRAKNENLKRIKVEFQPVLNREATSSTEQPVAIPGNAAGALQSSTSNERPTPPDADAAFNPTFMLPDLNMPFEDPCPDILCSVS